MGRINVTSRIFEGALAPNRPLAAARAVGLMTRSMRRGACGFALASGPPATGGGSQRCTLAGELTSTGYILIVFGMAQGVLWWPSLRKGQ